MLVTPYVIDQFWKVEAGKLLYLREYQGNPQVSNYIRPVELLEGSGRMEDKENVMHASRLFTLSSTYVTGE